MEVESSVARHYAHGSLEQAIFGALSASGKDLSKLTPADLAPIDEFHIGGRQATADLATQVQFASGSHLLDIGSGLGGASRYFAHEYKCRVTGIDLTEEYVRVAEALSRCVGLEKQVSYIHGSALAVPSAPHSFDGAYMLHVGMNVPDKEGLFAEVHRVLKPSGVFAIYDVMRTEKAGDLAFPVPWASSPDTSFVESAADYRSLLERAGFAIEKERSRREFAIEFFRQMRARAAEADGPPPVGLHILMGTSTTQKVRNMLDNLERGLIEPTEIVCRAT